MLKDKCGVFGIYCKDEDVAKITYFGLYSLQHRGQEGAGIAVTDGHKIKSIKGLGLVPTVFNDKNILSLKGHIAIGHTRYSTTGGNTFNNVQPIICTDNNSQIALAHNGNIINALHLSKTLKGVRLISTTDTEVMGYMIMKAPGRTLEQKIAYSIRSFQGAYSMVLLAKNKLFAFRDPYGFRPLVLGKFNGGYVVCSETCALDTVGAKYIRDVKPGEVVSIDNKGITVVARISSQKKAFCLFEYIYLARPDSMLNKQLVHQVRQRSGEILSYEAPVAGDIVAAVPDSGTSSAIGYSKASGIPFGEILIKNRYIGRTFIQPDQRIRDMGVKIKFNPLKTIVKGKRIIIVDDSIVRGTTIKKIIEVLRHCGAKKVHIRICSPPITDPCYFGVDTPDRKHLIAAGQTVPQIEKFINADSLKYLSLTGMIRATHQKEDLFCKACFTGKYPLPVDENFKKDILEAKPLRLAILISGGGTTAEAIIKAFQNGDLKRMKPVIVISSKVNAVGLQKAKKLGIQTAVIEKKNYPDRVVFGKAILDILIKNTIDIVSQNGWLPLTPGNIIEKYTGRIINQHPGALDPGRGIDFGGVGMYGARVICAQIAYAWITGKNFSVEATTHLVTDQFDEGDLIRTEKLHFSDKHSMKRINEIKKNPKLLIEATKKIQSELLLIEHKNVIATLQQFADKEVREFRRPKALITTENIEILKEVKELAIQLFPHG